MRVPAAAVRSPVAGFSGLLCVEDGPRDPARVAAQVVSGIGFLGAGTIFRTPSTVRGLTTAASIWLVAGTGMLIGTGMYTVAIFTTGCAFVALQWLRYPSHRRRRVGKPSLAGDDGDDSEE
jgi:putative Mg2+ transporter-C (MgtC) family protein